MSTPIKTFAVGEARVAIYKTSQAGGRAAAENAVTIIRDAIARKGKARLIIGTGNSQIHVVHSLVEAEGIDWEKVEVFHMDEYVGVSEDHPASFRKWLKTELVEKVRPGGAHYLKGDAEDLEGEIARYAALLNAEPIDIAFVGIGENGHIAFNEPHEADFEDTATLKIISLDEKTIRQQVGEGHFQDDGSVPRQAVTITCSGLYRAEKWICCINETRKAEAVKTSLEGGVTPSCPGSLVQRKTGADLFLDEAAATLLNGA